MNAEKKPAKHTQIKLPGVVIVIFNGKETRSVLADPVGVILPKAVAS